MKKAKINKDFVIVVLIFISVALSLYTLLSTQQVPTQLQQLAKTPISELSTTGFVLVEPSVDVTTSENTIMLSGGCYQITAGTDPSKVGSISKGISRIVELRPGTHDLMKDILENLGVKILMVKVVDIKENNFIGRLIVQQGNKILSLDSRPSDGIALAVRTNTSIYFKEDLLKQYGKNIC